MKSTAIALGLATVALALPAATPASAKGVDFSLSIAGPNGAVAIDNVGYGKKRRHGYGHNKGYGYPGSCLYPGQVRQKLQYQGWRGLNVIRAGTYSTTFRAYKHGTPYRLGVDRCTGRIVHKTPLYRYGY